MRQMGARSFVSFLLIVLGLSPGNEYAYAQSTAGELQDVTSNRCLSYGSQTQDWRSPYHAA